MEHFVSRCNNNIVLDLQKKIKSVIELKLRLEKQIFQLRNEERSLMEEIYSSKMDTNLLTEKLEELKDKISEISYQIQTIEINKIAGKIKMDHSIADLNSLKHGYDAMFEKERLEFEQRNKQMLEKETEELELEKKRAKRLAEKNEHQASEAAKIEEDCEAIERECAVLKKRNNAIMLKLRRKLIEAEDSRRLLMKQNSASSDSTAVAE